MKSKILQVALQIAKIEEEFSEEEILKAVQLLQTLGSSSQILKHLSDKNIEVKSQSNSNSQKKQTKSVNSTSLDEVKKNEPKKYKILVDFESLLKQGEVLSKSSEIRELGKSLSKDFSARNSRSHLIQKLIQLLVNYSVDEIKKIIQALQKSDTEQNDYQQLANFIIKGRSD